LRFGLPSGKTPIENYMKIKSKELVNILKKQKIVNEDISKEHKILSEADKRHKKLQFKVQRLKDKGVKILDKVLKEQADLKEFEFTGQMEIVNDEEFEVDVHDVFSDNFRDSEVVKERLRKDKKEKQGMWQDPLMFTGHKCE